MPAVLLVFISCLLVSAPALAGWDFLTFWKDKHPFEITVPGNKSLQETLILRLRQEHKENPELRQLSDPSAIARYELDVIKRYLRSKGYYDAQVEFIPAAISQYQVNSGELYFIEQLTFDLPLVTPALDPAVLKIARGQPLDAAIVLATQAQIEEYYAKNSCWYEIKATYDAHVNHGTHQARVHFSLAPSEKVVIGSINLEGAETVANDYIAHYINITSGECLNRAKLEMVRLELLQTGLFSTADIEVLPPNNGQVDLRFHFVERHFRTIKGGASFDADAGPGISLGWAHRNFLGRGQKFEADAEVSKITQKIDSKLTVPHFLEKSQNLVWHAEFGREEPEAFSSTTGDLGVEINRRFSKKYVVGAGVETIFSRVVEDGDESYYNLLGVPLTLDIDQKDNTLDPRKGWAVGLKTERYWDITTLIPPFQKTTLAASYYFTLEHGFWQPTWALRFASGSISAENLDSVPADERFYVGGGGSVRGYAYQSVGPLTDNKADGGLSYGEAATEIRLKINAQWGAVAFLDGGLAYPGEMPRWGSDFLWGAGVGVRYYTSFAPIRFDVAVPLNPRPELDDSFQLYVSIGQAF